MRHVELETEVRGTHGHTAEKRLVENLNWRALALAATLAPHWRLEFPATEMQ